MGHALPTTAKHVFPNLLRQEIISTAPLRESKLLLQRIKPDNFFCLNINFQHLVFPNFSVGQMQAGNGDARHSCIFNFHIGRPIVLSRLSKMLERKTSATFFGVHHHLKWCSTRCRLSLRNKLSRNTRSTFRRSAFSSRTESPEEASSAAG